MNWFSPPYTEIHFLTAGLSVCLAWIAWRRQAPAGAGYFAALMLAAAEWTFMRGFEASAVGLPAKVFWAKWQYPGIISMPPLWLMFALAYSQREHWLTRRNLLWLWVIPLITLALIPTTESHRLIWTDITPVSDSPTANLRYGHGPWFWLATFYNYTLILLGSGLLIKVALRFPRAYRWQAAALLIAVAVPLVGNAVYLMGFSPLPGFDLTPLAFTITGLFLAVSLVGFQLFDITPIARSVLIENMSDSVIVLDARQQIVDLNPAALRGLECERNQILGQALDTVYAAWPALVAYCRQTTAAQTELWTGAEVAARCFDVRLSPLHDRQGRLTGRLVVLRDITQRKRAEEALHRRTEYLAALNAMMLSLSSRRAVNEILGDIVWRAGQLVETPHGYLDVVEGSLLEPKIATGALSEAIRHKVKPGEGVAGTVWQTGQPLVVDDYDGWAGRIRDFSEKTIRTVMGVPLKSGERVVGVLGLAHDFTTTRTFGPEDVELMAQFAQLAVIALDNALFFEKERTARMQAETLREVTRALNTSLDREQVLTVILEQLARMVDYDSASVMLITGQELEIVAHRGLHLTASPLPRLPMKMLVNIQEVVSTRRPLIIDDVSNDTRWQWLDAGATHIHNWLGVPLLAQNHVIGLLNLDKHQPGYYTDRHAEIATAFAAQAAIAIENARLFAATHEALEREQHVRQETEQRLNELAAIDAISQAAASQLESQSLLQLVGERIYHLLSIQAVYIALYEAHTGLITFPYWRVREQRVEAEPIQYGQGLTSVVLRSRQPLVINDHYLEQSQALGVVPRFRQITGRAPLSWLGVPIPIGEEVIGVISLQHYEREQAFAEAEVRLLQTIAANVGIALHNARLFAVVEKASMSDGLTGLANRRHFDVVLEREWKRARRQHTPLALLMLDVDCFKLYNDTYGHPAGDDCLRQVASVLTRAAQRPVDLAARYGGEEFALILPDTTPEGAAHVADHICAGLLALRIPHAASKFSEWLTISSGFAALIPDPGAEAEVLLALADEALYRSKRSRVPR